MGQSGKPCMKKRKWNHLYLDMSPEELIEEYEASMGHSPITLELIKSEIWRREAEKINKRIYDLTVVIAVLTIIITVLTAISAFSVVYSILK